MKIKSSTYWLISALFLATAALWGVVSKLSDMISTSTMCGVALIVFGAISVIVAFSHGIKSAGSGWLLAEGLFSFCCGISYIFPYINQSLFAVDLGLVMGLWMMCLGVSQLVRLSKKGKTFVRVVVTTTAVLTLLCGLALYVRPVAMLMQLSDGGLLQIYSTSFQFVMAALLVASRLLVKNAH